MSQTFKSTCPSLFTEGYGMNSPEMEEIAEKAQIEKSLERMIRSVVSIGNGTPMTHYSRRLFEYNEKDEVSGYFDTPLRGEDEDPITDKCNRCWKVLPEVIGKELCLRCNKIINS